MPDYNLEGVRWSAASYPVTWSIATQNYSDRNYQFSSFLNSDYYADVQAVFAKWSSVANIDFQQVADSDQADIRIGFNAIDGAYGTAGITQYIATSSNSNSGYVFKDADIEMDTGEGWHNVDGHEMNAGNSFSFYSVLLHEVGHAIGLAHYNDAPAIMNAVGSVSDLQQPDIDGIQAIYGTRSGYTGGGNSDPGYSESYDDNGSHLVDVDRSGVTLYSSNQDVFRNHNQESTTFVFNPGYGHDLIGGFNVSGDGRSIIDLPSSDFSSLADVLRHTQNTDHGAVIHDAVSGDTIRLVGVSKGDLIQNRQDDIVFHA